MGMISAAAQVSASSLGSFRMGMRPRLIHRPLSSPSSVTTIRSSNLISRLRDSPICVAELGASRSTTYSNKAGKKVTTGSKATEQKTTPPTPPPPQQEGRSNEVGSGVSAATGAGVASAKGSTKTATAKVSEGGGGKHKKERQRVADAASQLTPAEVRSHVVDISKTKEEEPLIASHADDGEDKQGHHRPVYSGPKFVALSIKYAATGRGHNDRYPCWVAAVDEHGNVLVDLKVRVPGLVSPLTPLTGLIRRQIEEGQPLERAVAELKKHIRHGAGVVTLIGETPADDSAWLGIEQGQDFATAVDLPQTFAVRKTKGANAPIRLPLWALASGLSDNMAIVSGASTAAPHGGSDAVAEAKTAMALFTEVLQDGQKTEKAKRTLRHLLNAESPLLSGSSISSSKSGGVHAEGIDGVCCSKYDPAGCFCGQPVAKHWLHHES